MSQQIVALVGLSGVGKTTFLRGVAGQLQFQHLQASALIKEGRQVAEARTVSSDALRHANIDENQQFLIDGFNGAVDAAIELVVLDGHTIIDTENGVVTIPPSVFRELGITALAVLADQPDAIARRRELDAGRSRPARNVTELEALQNASLSNALAISLSLGIAMCVFLPNQRDEFCRYLSARRSTEA